MIRAAASILLLARLALAGDWSSIYDQATLEREKPRLQMALGDLAAKEIKPYLTEQQLHAYAAIEFDEPLLGASRSPVEFYSEGANRITVPVSTLLFVEDAAKAYTWLWANRCSSQTVDEYMGMLRFTTPEGYAGKKYPAPLVALHIPADVAENDATKKMFVRVRSTAYAFMVLHEFGHIRYVSSAEEAKQKHDAAEVREEQADLFALDIMKRNSEVPSGLLLFIHAMMYLPAQHPMTAHRLLAMADYLDLRVLEFAEGRPDRRLAITAIQTLARHLRSSAKFMADEEGQRLWAEQARETNPASLKPRRQ